MISAQSDILQMLDRLQHSEFNFYLTGSRFFGNHRETSDWDFFCDDDKMIHKFLTQNGFNLLQIVNGQTKYGTFYADKNVARVYRHRILHIDIQCQTDIHAKIAAQRVVKSLYPYLDKWINSAAKDQVRNVWNAVYRALEL